MQRRLLVAASLATLAVAAQPARACDITKLKAAMAECDEIWGGIFLMALRGYCYAGDLILCDLL